MNERQFEGDRIVKVIRVLHEAGRCLLRPKSFLLLFHEATQAELIVVHVYIALVNCYWVVSSNNIVNRVPLNP